MTDTPDRFKYVFSFAVGVVSFSALLSLWVVFLDKSQISMVLTFWLSSGASSCLGFLVGSSIQKGKTPTPDPGTATVEISATASTVVPDVEKDIVV